MKFKNYILPLCAIVFFIAFNAKAENNDCSCPKVTCGPCQKAITVGKTVKFCDWGDISVCKKVICENVNFYFGCLSKRKKSAEEEPGEKDLELVYETGSSANTKKGRKPASKKDKISNVVKADKESQGRIEVGNESRNDPGIEYSDLVVGEVLEGSKSIKIFHRGQFLKPSKNRKLYVGDEIINSRKSPLKIKIGFEEGEVLVDLQGKSKMIVHDPHSIIGRFQPFLYLVHGGCDFYVKMKEGASFDLLAGQILARSSNGHHQVMYVMDEEGLKVRVESFKDKIDVIKAQDLSGKKIEVQAGHFVSWVSETPGHLFTQDEKLALAGEGFITPIFQMSEVKRRSLGLLKEKPILPEKKWALEQGNVLKPNLRNLASLNESGGLCQSPAADFQQCAWSCEGNPQGAKGCLADKEGVHCIRRVCNAAGQWGIPTPFATSYKDMCPARGVRVGDCAP